MQQQMLSMTPLAYIAFGNKMSPGRWCGQVQVAFASGVQMPRALHARVAHT